MPSTFARFFASPAAVPGSGSQPSSVRTHRLASLLLATMVFAGAALAQAPADQIREKIEAAKPLVLPHHHPQWANPGNDLGPLVADQQMAAMTLVLARTAEREAALQTLLAEQQNPASPQYHHWLTPAELGERFGLSDHDLAALTGWLQASGLVVNQVAQSRAFINFGGTAAAVGRAFQTEVHGYRVHGAERFSVSSDPIIPQALAPAIQAIRGLYSVEERPSHLAEVQSAAPLATSSTGNHYIAPADFAAIYGVPASWTGAGQTIAIVGRSRTDFADFTAFRGRTGVNFPNPNEVVPTAYGGADPGPALTAPPTGGTSTGEQSEATLDVLRAGSTAPGAQLLLVVATGTSGGIDADAQYVVDSTPLPAQVMSMSYGACESSAGSSGVTFWNTLFQQAAVEGISVFISSGDSGAAGCDTDFTTPPSNPAPISPNYICSSSYATCVGGTEFNDSANPSTYWSSSSNATTLESAYGHIPEGGWNDPMTSPAAPALPAPQIAASGGGVSAYIATPSWQTGTGVPAARAGRYTPDISFSGSCHDGYFGCFAAGGGSCVTGSNGGFSFESFCGTSAAAPSMAGVAALLNQKLGAAQGNLNPGLYLTATNTPTAFYDATVASSGVGNCSVNTPSMCNNSAPGTAGLTGGQAGYLVATGYDEVTGLGSLNVTSFLNNFSAKSLPTVGVTLSASAITVSQPLTVTVVVTGGSGNATLTGSVTLTGGGYISAAATLSNNSATINVPAGSLAVGTDPLTVAYTPDAASSAIFSSASNAVTVTVTTPVQASFAVAGTNLTLTRGATTSNTTTVTVTPSGGFTGSVALTAALASGPSGYNTTYQPYFTFGSTSPCTISGAGACSATMTVTTTAATSSTLSYPRLPWYAGGATALASLLMLALPRRRDWRRFFAAFVLAALAGGMVACGGGAGSNSGGGSGGGIAGTTAGTYTVTVTGTYNATTTAQGTVTLVVQ